MEKDPAYLFYSKDWLQGTAKLFTAEKGVFIDLLAHQHQDGFLPVQLPRLAKMVGLSMDEFLPIWEGIKDKFYEKDGKFFNKKLVSVINNRNEHGDMRAIIGTFGQVSKSLICLPEEKERIRKKFNYEDFIGVERANLSKVISNWASNCLANDGIGTVIIEEEENKGIGDKFLVPEMFNVFKKSVPTYPGSVKKDFQPLGSIAKFLLEQLDSAGGDTVANMPAILKEWELLCPVIAKDKFYKSKSLSVISNQIQEIFQISKNGKSVNSAGGGTAKSVEDLLSKPRKW